MPTGPWPPTPRPKPHLERVVYPTRYREPDEAPLDSAYLDAGPEYAGIPLELAPGVFVHLDIEEGGGWDD